ncbi:hypothetical protein [Bacillus halotolerans]|uniref:hypothetical protein n=1 Tax=Bacillus halotolerans TaxID=260554 RepID=UPI00192A98E2|nr:hypothetical protein [Bacillus halotolerans]MBL4978794.1 hypothetical protein [Bacillus halotolerans]
MFIGTSNQGDLFNAFRDFVFAYTVYQLFLLVTFKLVDSLKDDGFNSIKGIISTVELYKGLNMAIPISYLDKWFEKKENPMYTLTKQQREIINTLVKYAHAYNRGIVTKDQLTLKLKLLSIFVENELNCLKFGWMNSILLRIFK